MILSLEHPKNHTHVLLIMYCFHVHKNSTWFLQERLMVNGGQWQWQLGDNGVGDVVRDNKWQWSVWWTCKMVANDQCWLVMVMTWHNNMRLTIEVSGEMITLTSVIDREPAKWQRITWQETWRYMKWLDNAVFIDDGNIMTIQYRAGDGLGSWLCKQWMKQEHIYSFS